MTRIHYQAVIWTDNDACLILEVEAGTPVECSGEFFVTAANLEYFLVSVLAQDEDEARHVARERHVVAMSKRQLDDV